MRSTFADTEPTDETPVTGPIRVIIFGASAGSWPPARKRPWPPVTWSRFVPSRSSVEIRSALLDAEIPSTATIDGDPDRDPERGEHGPRAARPEGDGADADDVGREQPARGQLGHAWTPVSCETMPSRISTRRGIDSAICGLWVTTTIVVPSALSSSSSARISSPVVRVEVPRRLVGEHDRGPPEHGARDRDALALAARERVRVVAEAVREPDAVERLARPLAPRRGIDAAVEQAARDVVERATCRR